MALGSDSSERSPRTGLRSLWPDGQMGVGVPGDPRRRRQGGGAGRNSGSATNVLHFGQMNIHLAYRQFC